MAKKMNRWMTKAAFLALSVATVLSANSPSWARSYRFHDEQPQGGRCVSWQDCSGSAPRHPSRPSYNPYEQDYGYDERGYDDERPSYPYDPYERTITIPAPGLPQGADKIIEGMFDLLQQIH
jgi:hypothetical protein